MPLFFMHRMHFDTAGAKHLGQNSHQTGVNAAHAELLLTDYVSSTQGIALICYPSPHRYCKENFSSDTNHVLSDLLIN